MAWNIGDLITAEKLNAENEVAMTANGGMYPNYSEYNGLHYCYDTGEKVNGYAWCGPESGIYMHSTNCRFKVWRRNGWGNCECWIYKMENGSWVEKHHQSWGWNSSGTRDFTMEWGIGWYRFRIRADATGRCSGALRPFRTDNVKGDYLCYFDSPTNSGNRIPGTLLTTNVLKSGKVSTLPNL